MRRINDRRVYARSLRNADQIRTFTIRPARSRGWDVLDEQDSTIVKSIRYDDWHRVERAKARFALEAWLLRERGWVES